MILGTGIDIIELNRIEQVMRRNPRFIKKILTKQEEELFQQKKSTTQKCEFLAGRFAGKEAFVKAFGTGIGKVNFHDIEILTGAAGEPTITFGQFHQFNIHISISHSRTYAIAQVILER
ncbi:holo-ACP synthase [Amphibacillus sp. Q70]|uniref:holo-ACP synthase n=1 Tax=Amphibacillus sp. Q70 TaxID=3453416 RepID=UPI003F837CBF